MLSLIYNRLLSSFRKKQVIFYRSILFNNTYKYSFLEYDRTKTDTGRLVEYTKVYRRIMLKELGKMTL